MRLGTVEESAVDQNYPGLGTHLDHRCHCRLLIWNLDFLRPLSLGPFCHKNYLCHHQSVLVLVLLRPRSPHPKVLHHLENILVLMDRVVAHHLPGCRLPFVNHHLYHNICCLHVFPHHHPHLPPLHLVHLEAFLRSVCFFDDLIPHFSDVHLHLPSYSQVPLLVGLQSQVLVTSAFELELLLAVSLSSVKWGLEELLTVAVTEAGTKIGHRVVGYLKGTVPPFAKA